MYDSDSEVECDGELNNDDCIGENGGRECGNEHTVDSSDCTTEVVPTALNKKVWLHIYLLDKCIYIYISY